MARSAAFKRSFVKAKVAVAVLVLLGLPGVSVAEEWTPIVENGDGSKFYLAFDSVRIVNKALARSKCCTKMNVSKCGSGD
jgi:hypothetical protein